MPSIVAFQFNQIFNKNLTFFSKWHVYKQPVMLTSGSAIAEGPRDVLVSRNSATTKYRYRDALFA